jgi:hypothetical protein
MSNRIDLLNFVLHKLDGYMPEKLLVWGSLSPPRRSTLSVHLEATVASSSRSNRRAMAYTRMGSIPRKLGDISVARRPSIAGTSSYLVATANRAVSSSKDEMGGWWMG